MYYVCGRGRVVRCGKGRHLSRVWLRPLRAVKCRWQIGQVSAQKTTIFFLLGHRGTRIIAAVAERCSTRTSRHRLRASFSWPGREASVSAQLLLQAPAVRQSVAPVTQLLLTAAGLRLFCCCCQQVGLARCHVVVPARLYFLIPFPCLPGCHLRLVQPPQLPLAGGATRCRRQYCWC